MQQTPYYLQTDYIFGPSGYTNTYIYSDNQIYDGYGPTGFYVSGDSIYGPRGYSLFYIYNYQIYGPERELPWFVRSD